jgi:glutathione S-transferase
MITVHHLNNSRSQRILWLLEELELEYEVKHYERNPESMLAPPSLLNIHPLGKSPVITDDNLTLAESGAIIEYLVDHYGKGRLAPPLCTPERLQYTYWLHYAEGSAMPPLFLKLIFDRLEKHSMVFFLRPVIQIISQRVKKSFIEPQISIHLSYLESILENSIWFAGKDFTAADIQMSFPLETITTRANFDQSYPKLIHFLQRIHNRTAYQRALERGIKK